jgi:UDPglucose 6-dehydrogenase
MKVTISGAGYVGLVTGVCLAEVGHYVICIDCDEGKIEKLKQGKSPIYEPELEELIEKNISAGRLEFTIDYKAAYKKAEVIFIAVGTPENIDGSANLSYVFTVAKQIAESIENDCLVVLKSTVPIGTNDKVEELISDNIRHNVSIQIASNPEFLSQGSAVRDTLKASRIVIGVKSENAEHILREVYEPFNRPIIVTNPRSAEMIKYASNDFLALKISFINDIANLCEVVGANIDDVTTGMSYDSRIGDKFLNAGIGYGGSCFPKDTKALHWLAIDHGYELKTIKAAIEVNETQKTRLLDKARKQFSTFKNVKVAVLGLTFKPGTDDLRDAPSLENVRILLDEGANIYAYDPAGINNFKKIYPHLNYVNTPYEAIKNADICFIFTEWKQIKEIHPMDFFQLMKTPNVYDGRNCYSPISMNQYGVNYHSIGRELL